eukprot:c35088_g1_i1 orf=117-269(-)
MFIGSWLVGEVATHVATTKQKSEELARGSRLRTTQFYPPQWPPRQQACGC